MLRRELERRWIPPQVDSYLEASYLWELLSREFNRFLDPILLVYVSIHGA